MHKPTICDDDQRRHTYAATVDPMHAPTRALVALGISIPGEIRLPNQLRSTRPPPSPELQLTHNY